MTRRSHAARVESSERLQQTLAVLRGGAWQSSRDIFTATGSMAVHSDIHELRQNGFQIEQRYSRTTDSGRRVSQYRLNETQPVGGPNPGDSHPVISASSQPQPVPGGETIAAHAGSATETATGGVAGEQHDATHPPEPHQLAMF